MIDAFLLRDYLRTLERETVINIYMSVDDGDPVLFEIDDSDYQFVVMPMSKPAEKKNAKPDADTGIEVAGQVSTEEVPMSEVDEPLDSDDTDLQTRFFQLLSENEQLQAKAVHYKTLLDRAMRVIEKLQHEQRVSA